MPRSNALIGIACLALSEAAVGQTCTINFDGVCPTAVADQCGAFFDGGGGCVFAGLAFCYDTGLFSYKVTNLTPLTITIPDGLDALEVFFVGQGAASGEMRFFDAEVGGNEVDAPITTNGNCLLVMPPRQSISFTSAVRRIDVTATGGTVWIDTFIATPHLDCSAVNECSGHGTCIATNTCACDIGWTDPDCSTPICAGVNNCSGNGTCIAPDTCACDIGWTGLDCSTPICAGVNDCSGNGTCIAPDTCACNVGWMGLDCSTPICAGVNDCSGNGTCIAPDTCQCDPGWIGVDCSMSVPVCDGVNNCSGNGTCVALDTCQCDTGWLEADCSASDCNNNGVADGLDIAGCAGEAFCLDGNANGIPDVCELSPPLPEDSLGITNCVLDSECVKEAYCVPDAGGGFPGTCYAPKNRYLSLAPNPVNDVPSARRLSVVTFERSCGGAGNTACTSDTQCAASPDGNTCDDVATGTQVIGWFAQPDADGFAAVVEEASRHYTVWADATFPIECGVDELCPAGSHCDVGLGASNTCRFDADDTEVPSTVVQLTGCHISPKKRDVRSGMNENRAGNYYLIEAISGGANLTVASNYSAPLELRTVVVWADMTGGIENNLALPPDDSPGFLDILHQVNRFKGKGKATTAWLDLDPQEPDHSVGFLDMLQGVGGFKDAPYPGDDPCSCAGLAPCN